MFTIRTVFEPYTDPDGSPAEGFVVFWPSTVMINGGTTAPSRVRADLAVDGVMTALLCANDDAGTSPLNAYYWVEEHIKGAPTRRYRVIITAVGSGPIRLSTLVTIEDPPALVFGSPGEQGPVGPQGPPGQSDHGLLTGLADDDHAQYHNNTRGDVRYYLKTEVDALVGSGVTAELTRLSAPPQTLTASAGAITPGATAGWLFEYIATANVQLNAPTSGQDGWPLTVRVLASGADRTLSFAGGALPAEVIPSGEWWIGSFIFDSATDKWVRLAGGGAASTSGGGSGGVTDHGALTGLSDDDHTQYYNQTRGDARYVLATALNELVDDRVAALLVAGTNVTLTYNDAAGTLSVAAASGGGGSAVENTHAIAAAGSAVTLDPATTGTYKLVTLTAASCTITLGAGVAGQVVRMDVDLIMDATGGRAVVWPTSSTLKWVGGSPPTLVTSAGAINSFTLWNPNNLGWRAAPVGMGIS